jgi:hypothetical protein
MWEDNPISAYLVLGLSNFGGGVAKVRWLGGADASAAA